MKQCILALVCVLAFSCSATYQISTLNHDPEIRIIDNEFQLDRLLRQDFKFRWNFAQYAMNQPYSWYMSNYGFNRFNRFSSYNRFDIYWNSTQYWTDWAFNYPFQSSYYGWNRPFNWGYSQHSWYNDPWHNQGYNSIWNRSRGNNVAYHTGRRGSSNIQSKIVASSTNRTRIVTNVDIEELAVKLRNKLPNKNIRIYKNPNNPNINNNSKPRVYVRPNNNNTMRTNTRLVTSKPVINPIIRNKKNN